MIEEEYEEGESGPSPPDFHKVEIEDVRFASKIRGSQVRRVGLRDARIRC